jgi:hypothetical protein
MFRATSPLFPFSTLRHAEVWLWQSTLRNGIYCPIPIVISMVQLPETEASGLKSLLST